LGNILKYNFVPKQIKSTIEHGKKEYSFIYEFVFIQESEVHIIFSSIVSKVRMSTVVELDGSPMSFTEYPENVTVSNIYEGKLNN